MGVKSSNANSSNVAISAPRNTASAIAPPMYPTVPCFKGVSVGAQGPAFGASFGGGKIDQNCAILETARSFAGVEAYTAYCKVMLTNKYVKKAHVSMEDCMDRYEPELPVVVAAPEVQQAPTHVITISVPAPIITVNVPAPVAPVVEVTKVAVPKAVVHRKVHVANPCVTPGVK